tara:strand:+ start:2876 stop:3268 length:393 start_codon:yes stop_codon:yes gene_type:complete
MRYDPKDFYLEDYPGWNNVIDRFVDLFIVVDKEETMYIDRIDELYGTIQFHLGYYPSKTPMDLWDNIMSLKMAFSAESTTVCSICGEFSRGSYLSCVKNLPVASRDNRTMTLCKDCRFNIESRKEYDRTY